MVYWLAMNLAGDYTSACHHTIYAKIAKAIGEKPLAIVENRHNLAWKEMYEGKEMIVHRKVLRQQEKLCWELFQAV